MLPRVHLFGLLCSILKSQNDVEYYFILLFYLQDYFYDFYIVILNATFNYNSQSFERCFTGGRFGKRFATPWRPKCQSCFVVC